MYPEPVEVSYAAVQRLIPKLYEQSVHYDIKLHLGVSAEHSFYEVEQFASKESWRDIDIEDVQGSLPSFEYELEHWSSCPVRLATSARLDDVQRRWQAEAYVCRHMLARTLC